jgi:hypothetical protein
MQAGNPAFTVCLEQKVACKQCASEAQQDFPSELSVVFPGLQGLNLSPVYICQNIFVCLDCGFTELVIPGPELDRLTKGMTGSSRSQTA